MATALGRTDRGGGRTAETELYKVKGELRLMRDSPDEAEAERWIDTGLCSVALASVPVPFLLAKSQ